MIKTLLSVSLPRHDGNLSYFDGSALHYIKLERLTQIKRSCIEPHFMWSYVVKDVFGEEALNADAFVFDFHAETFYSHPYPKWLQDVLSGKEVITEIPLEDNIFRDITAGKPVWYVSHHYAHALSSWMLEDKPVNTRFVIDGIGDHRTWSIFKGNRLIAYGDKTHGSIGGLTARSATELGIVANQFNDLAGKLMSLQSYGSVDHEFLRVLQQYNIKQLLNIFDRALWIDHKKDALVAHHSCLDWIRTVFCHVETLLIDLFSTYSNPEEIISYAGGVAQNVVWNTALKNVFPNLIIPPHSADEGLSLGAIEALRLQYGLPIFELPNFPYIQKDHASETIEDETIKQVARALAAGKIVAWYQGNGEAGPRALGNRSILMNPCVANGKQIINSVKNRENYRPFGASVLEEFAAEYFDVPFGKDEFMLYVAKINKTGFDAIAHVDGTCRIQTVGENNVAFRKLLQEFHKLTGIPVLLNTSLNLSGAPIAGYPEVAKMLFEKTNVSCAVIGNVFLEK